MVTELLRATGLSVGTYTSPHLERHQRAARRGTARPIDDDALGEAIGTIAAVEPLAGVTPSYFEILTAAAFAWFADLAVDVAVVEVGLLGRFDATNVADGQVAVLTNVGRDHTDGGPGWRAKRSPRRRWASSSPGSTFVLGETDPELRSVFAAAPAEETWLPRRATSTADANRVALGGRLVDLRTPGVEVDDVFLPLHGAHQADNAAVALAAAEAFFGQAARRRPGAGGLRRRPRAGPVRGRATESRPWCSMRAHNVDGAPPRAADPGRGVHPRRHHRPGGRPPRRARSRARCSTRSVPPTPGSSSPARPTSPRAIPAPEVAAAADGAGRRRRVGTVGRATRCARALAVAGPDDLVLVTGSLYVVGAGPQLPARWRGRRARPMTATRDRRSTRPSSRPTTRAGAGAARSSSAATRSATDRVQPGALSPRRTVPADDRAAALRRHGRRAATGARHRCQAARRDRAHAPHRPRRRRDPGRRSAPRCAPGITTDELDAICHQACIDAGGYPSPLNYNGFPKSLCTSVNEVICHGIPDSRGPARRRHRQPRRHPVPRGRARRHQRHVPGRAPSTTESQRLVRGHPRVPRAGHRRGAPGPADLRHRPGHPGPRRGQRLRRGARLHRPRRRRRVPHRPADPALLRPPGQHASWSRA